MPPTLQLGVPTVAFILITVWVLGSVSSLTMGGALHVLLVAAVVMMLPRVIRGRKRAE